jgi:hypothetical protein
MTPEGASPDNGGGAQGLVSRSVRAADERAEFGATDSVAPKGAPAFMTCGDRIGIDCSKGFPQNPGPPHGSLEPF